MATPRPPPSARGPRETTMNMPRSLKGKGKHRTTINKRVTSGPINFLPPEVLGEIFLASLRNTFPIHDNYSVPPLQFCHVCSYWRQTALSTPGLWARLLINRDATPQEIEGITTKWFSSAGGLPLSLRIQNETYPNYLISSRPRSSFGVTLQRIHNLEISARCIEVAVQLINDIVGPETNIERLVIQCNQWTSFWSPVRFKFPKFNKLKRVVLSNFCLDQRPYDGCFDNMPWNHLTHLSMIDVPMVPTTWMSFLRRCTQLQRGFFALSDTESLVPANQWAEMPQGDTVLPSVIFLKVVFQHSGEWGIFHGLSLPSLKTLCLGTMKGLSTWRSTTPTALHAPLIRNLTLFKVKIQYPDLVELLMAMSGLRTLILDVPLDFSPLFEKLSHTGNNIFLPNLVRLSIYHWRTEQNQPITIDCKAFIRMIRARWYPSSKKRRPPLSSLSSVSLRTSIFSPKLIKIKNMLDSLVTEGLVLQIGLASNGYLLKKEVDW